VARDPDTIQREIERSRDALAASLDVLTARVNPKKLADDGRQAAAAKLADPKVKYALYAIGALVAVALVRSIFRHNGQARADTRTSVPGCCERTGH
jgi:Protein of unknown function (DUF3618)